MRKFCVLLFFPTHKFCVFLFFSKNFAGSFNTKIREESLERSPFSFHLPFERDPFVFKLSLLLHKAVKGQPKFLLQLMTPQFEISLHNNA
jgi:hypothetical protein